MIYSDLKSGGYCASIDEKIALCLTYAPSLNENTPCGRYELSEDVYVNVMSYEPKPVEDAVAETHRIYADLQLILAGAEWMGCADSAAMTPLASYDGAKDIALWLAGAEWMGCADSAAMTPLASYDGAKDIALWQQENLPLLPMRKGNWALFMPGEPHAPSLKMQEGTVKKAVFKIRYGGNFNQ